MAAQPFAILGIKDVLNVASDPKQIGIAEISGALRELHRCGTGHLLTAHARDIEKVNELFRGRFKELQEASCNR